MKMKIKFIFIVLLLCSCSKKEFFGHIYDYETEKPIENVYVSINDNTTKTDSTGYFCMKIKSNVPSVISLKKEGYFTKKITRRPDSLGRFSKEKINWNRIYLFHKESDFSTKGR